MKNLIVTVNGVASNVTVEEGTGAAAAGAGAAGRAAAGVHRLSGGRQLQPVFIFPLLNDGARG